MAIKRYKADADNTIVNAYQANMETRGTGSNAGAADVLEVFSIYGRQSTSSAELSRILVKFPISTISTDRTATTIPASGSVSFYLRLFNAASSQTVPIDYKLVVNAVSQSWQEGDGLDLAGYKDLTKGNIGSNWMSASNTTVWKDISNALKCGGSYITGGAVAGVVNTEIFTFEQTFSTGLEDMELNITPLVEQWIAGTYSNYGVGIRLSSSYEASSSVPGFNPAVAATNGVSSDAGILMNVSGATVSYYTKRFFARGSQYFFKRPVLEARWNSITRDDRGNFFYSSSLAPATDNMNTLYLYNYVRGRLIDIPGVSTGAIYVDLYSGSVNNTIPSGAILDQGNPSLLATFATGGWVSTGVYTCSVCMTAAATPLKTLYDVWHNGSGSQYFTGTIGPTILRGADIVRRPSYYMNITNLRDKYRKDEKARFNLYVRDKYWDPTVYTKAQATPTTTTIPSASYRVFKILDGFEAIPYHTGSNLSTGLSYDVSGNYFDLNMSLLEPGYAYAVKFAFYDPELVSWVEQEDVFKFRVEDYEY